MKKSLKYALATRPCTQVSNSLLPTSPLVFSFVLDDAPVLPTPSVHIAPEGSQGDGHSVRGLVACDETRCSGEGSSAPRPCPGGTWWDGLGAKTQASCKPVLPGFWAPLGSELPEPCPTTGFYCPGAAADTLYGGSKPVLVPVGESRCSLS